MNTDEDRIEAVAEAQYIAAGNSVPWDKATTVTKERYRTFAHEWLAAYDAAQRFAPSNRVKRSG